MKVMHCNNCKSTTEVPLGMEITECPCCGDKFVAIYDNVNKLNSGGEKMTEKKKDKQLPMSKVVKAKLAEGLSAQKIHEETSIKLSYINAVIKKMQRIEKANKK